MLIWPVLRPGVRAISGSGGVPWWPLARSIPLAIITSRGVRNVKRVALYKKEYKIGRKRP